MVQRGQLWCYPKMMLFSTINSHLLVVFETLKRCVFFIKLIPGDIINMKIYSSRESADWTADEITEIQSHLGREKEQHNQIWWCLAVALQDESDNEVKFICLRKRWECFSSILDAWASVYTFVEWNSRISLKIAAFYDYLKTFRVERLISSSCRLEQRGDLEHVIRSRWSKSALEFVGNRVDVISYFSGECGEDFPAMPTTELFKLHKWKNWKLKFRTNSREMK